MALPCLKALEQVADDVALLRGPLALKAGEGLRILPDVSANIGPLGGVDAALGSGLGELWIILPWDMPRVGPKELTPLADALRGGASIAVYRGAGTPTGLAPFPLGISTRAHPQLKAPLEGGQGSVWRFLASAPVEVLMPPPGDPSRLVGINTPEALGACPGSWDTTP